MDGQRERQRIEIELTSHAPAPRDAHRDEVSVESAEPPEAAESTATDDALMERPIDSLRERARGHLVLLTSAIAVTALLIGVVVGRMGGDAETDGETADVDDRGSEQPTTTPADVDPADTLPAAEPLPSPTTRPSPATTELAGPATSRVAVDPSVAAEGVEVVALTNRGEVVRLDVTTGTTISTDVESAQFGPLYAGEGWILIPSFDPGQQSVVWYDDGSRSSVALGDSWPVLTSVATGRIWVGLDAALGGVPDRLVEMTIEGDPTGVEVELQGFTPRTVDPLGGIVVDAPGGSYVLTPDSSTRLTPGRVVAIGRERVLAHECDDRLDCAHVVVERSSGDRRVLTLDPRLRESPHLEASAWWAFEGSWSPSEEALLVLDWNGFGGGRHSYGVLDVVDGGYTEIGKSLEVPSVRWVDDRSLLWLQRGRLNWFDVTTGESVLVTDELVALSAFTTRSLG